MLMNRQIFNFKDLKGFSLFTQRLQRWTSKSSVVIVHWQNARLTRHTRLYRTPETSCSDVEYAPYSQPSTTDPIHRWYLPSFSALGSPTYVSRPLGSAPKLCSREYIPRRCSYSGKHRYDVNFSRESSLARERRSFGIYVVFAPVTDIAFETSQMELVQRQATSVEERSR